MRTSPLSRHRRALWAFALSSALALVLASGVAYADGDDADADGIPDGIEAETERTVVGVSVADELSITSRLVNPPYEDEFGLSFRAGTFTLHYDRRDVRVEYSLELRNMVVFADVNGNGRVEATEIRSTVTLGSSAFGNVWFNRTTVQTTDGGRVLKFSIMSNTGLVTLGLTVAQRFMRLSADRILTPMEVKMDILVAQPSIQAGESLAIELRLETEGKVEYAERSWDELNHFAVNDGGMNVTGGPAESPATVFFSWAKTALADSRGVPVGLSNQSDVASGSYDLYLVYSLGATPPSRVFHDPTFGVRSEAFEGIVSRPPPLQADFLLYGGTLALMAALVTGTILLANRRRKKRE